MQGIKKIESAIKSNILEFWISTEQVDGKPSKIRTAFIIFMQREGMSRSCLYSYMNMSCRNMSMLKLRGLMESIKQFKKEYNKNELSNN